MNDNAIWLLYSYTTRHECQCQRNSTEMTDSPNRRPNICNAIRQVSVSLALLLGLSWGALAAGIATATSHADGVLATAISAAHELFEARQYDAAFTKIVNAADAGDAAAQHLLARLHLQPRFSRFDPREGARLLKLSASASFSPAQHDLAELYRRGVGLKKNPLQAFRWHLRAAEQHLRSSEQAIAVMYERGEGIAKNPAQAKTWAARAQRTRPKAAPPPQRIARATNSKSVSAKLANSPARPPQHPVAALKEPRVAAPATAAARSTTSLSGNSIRARSIAAISTGASSRIARAKVASSKVTKSAGTRSTNDSSIRLSSTHPNFARTRSKGISPTSVTPTTARPIEAKPAKSESIASRSEDSATRGYLVQLGAFKNSASAGAQRERIQRTLATVHSRLQVNVRSADYRDGRGLLHRLQAGPVRDLAAVSFVCRAIKQRIPGQGCFAALLRR